MSYTAIAAETVIMQTAPSRGLADRDQVTEHLLHKDKAVAEALAQGPSNRWAGLAVSAIIEEPLQMEGSNGTPTAF